MKLILDEHYSPAIAEQLQERGYDVVAVAAVLALRQVPDEELLRRAYQERRALVTENVGDFMPLHNAFLSRDEIHAGILFTSPRRFPRRTAAIGLLVANLAAFLDDHEGDEIPQSGIAWL